MLGRFCNVCINHHILGATYSCGDKKMFENPLVIGYKGEIGSFLLQELLKKMPKANNIWCTDVNNTEKEIVDRIKKSDVIFLCVPINKTVDWFHKYKRFLKNKLVIEQTSLKTHIFTPSEKWFGLKIVHMHLLFKPSGTPNIEDRRCVLVEGPNLTKELIYFIGHITGAKIIHHSSIADHDRQMAIQQALLHRTLITLEKFLNRNEGNTFIAGKVKELVARIRTIHPTLFSTIQSNVFLPAVLDEFKKELDNGITL